MSVCTLEHAYLIVHVHYESLEKLCLLLVLVRIHATESRAPSRPQIKRGMWASGKRYRPIIRCINQGLYASDVACVHLESDISAGQQ